MPGSALQSFLDRVDEPRRAELEAAADLRARLSAALEDARGAWGMAWLTEAEFTAEIADRYNRATGDAVSWLENLRAADLYLACACARGIEGALRQFEASYRVEILRTASRFERPSASAQDLYQRLCQHLFMAGDDRVPKIASFSGQGRLENWLRITMIRSFMDATRGSHDELSAPLEDALERMLPHVDPDPELELLKRQHSAHFKEAFAEAVGLLDPEDRHVLRLHVVEQLSIDQLAALQGVHRATAARRVVKAKDALVGSTKACLRDRLGLSEDQLESALRLIQSRLDASVERLLREA